MIKSGFTLASMEPQLFSCGLLKILPTPQSVVTCFNGAATFQLRIAVCELIDKSSLVALQWSRNFSVADCKTVKANLTTAKEASMEPQLFSCGLMFAYFVGGYYFMLQWSRNFSVADCQWRYSGRVEIGMASMEPQLFSCGLHGKTGLLCPQVNGCFNGAATFQLRIATTLAQKAIDAKQLQWSRNFSVADCKIVIFS